MHVWYDVLIMWNKNRQLSEFTSVDEYKATHKYDTIPK